MSGNHPLTKAVGDGDEYDPRDPGDSDFSNLGGKAQTQDFILANGNSSWPSSRSGHIVGRTVSPETQSSRAVRDGTSWSSQIDPFDAFPDNVSTPLSNIPLTYFSPDSFLGLDETRLDNSELQGYEATPSLAYPSYNRGDNTGYLVPQLYHSKSPQQHTDTSHGGTYFLPEGSATEPMCREAGLSDNAPWSPMNQRVDRTDRWGLWNPRYTGHTMPSEIGPLGMTGSERVGFTLSPLPTLESPLGRSTNDMIESEMTIRPRPEISRQVDASDATKTPAPQTRLSHRHKPYVAARLPNDGYYLRPGGADDGYSNGVQRDPRTEFRTVPTLATNQTQYLTVPVPDASNSDPSSPRSPASIGAPSSTSSELPEPLECPSPGCKVRFKGRYRKGNLARHRKQQHGGRHGSAITVPCEEKGCRKVFKRNDARLKHYRVRHPHRTQGPALPRKQNPAVVFEEQNEDLRNVWDGRHDAPVE